MLQRLGTLARDDNLLDQLVAQTNTRLQRQIPELLKQRQVLQKSLDEVNRTADRLLTGWASLEDDSISNTFISEKLNQLSLQRVDLESGLAEIDGTMEAAKQQGVDVAEVRRAVANVAGVYACLQPFEQRELMQLILQGAEINERQMVLEIRVGLGEALNGDTGSRGKKRFQGPDWLPEG